MNVSLRRSELGQDQAGRATWKTLIEEVELDPTQCAVLVCDVWDGHWCRGARERLAALVPRMDDTLRAARKRGMSIIHAPSDTVDFYAASPARKRILEAPQVEPPPDLHLPDPPLPVDDSDHGADTGEKEPYKAWHRQQEGLYIDEALDVISDSGSEIYSWLQHRGITWLFILGVHANMCILHRSFGIKQMVRWRVQTGLIRDLTDSMYNPAQPPYVSHSEGTNLVVGYIEKHWCPTLHSQYIVGL